MTGKKPRSLTSGVTRRAFVAQVTAGAAGAALAVSASTDLMAAVVGNGPADAAAPRLRAGALYYPWYRHDGTNWVRGGRVPALGLYDSSDLGVIDTHVTWALAAELDFLLVAQTGDATAGRTATLFGQSEKRGLNLGLMFVPGKDVVELAEAHTRSMVTRQQYISRAAAALRTRLESAARTPELRLPNYLKDANGRAVVAIRAWDTAEVMADVLDLAAASVRRDVALWTVPELQDDEWKVCAADGANVILASASASSPSTLARGAGYVVIDSFNDWRRGATLEPSVAEGRTAPARLAALRTILGIA